MIFTLAARKTSDAAEPLLQCRSDTSGNEKYNCERDAGKSNNNQTGQQDQSPASRLHN
jgi:hypothetical protein